MNNDEKALKSGIWYTFANVITRGLSFITTPFFSRLLSKEDFGLFSSFDSWVGILGILCTLNLGSTLISARFDYENDFDNYIRSVIRLGVMTSIIGFIIINVFFETFHRVFGLNRFYIDCAIIYVMFLSIIEMFQTREQFYFRYKRSVLISVIISVSTAGLSVALVLLLKNQLLGRILGYCVPTFIFGFGIFIKLYKRKQGINFYYWKYAIKYCLPYIPHLLSLTVLNSMDKIMITNMLGAEENALYSIAYTCGTAVTLLLVSMNTAFAPWLGNQLHEENYEKIRKFTYKYVFLFIVLAFGIMLLTPEILWILGDDEYREAMYVMPPVACGCIAQFLYTMFVNVEQFEKKTVWMAIASISAAILNYLLNLLFIPKFGYIAAADTTLISFIWLLLVHMFIVKIVGYGKVYDYRFILFIMLMSLAFTFFVNWIYSYILLRIIIITIFIAIIVLVLLKNKNQIMEFIINERK